MEAKEERKHKERMENRFIEPKAWGHTLARGDGTNLKAQMLKALQGTTSDPYNIERWTELMKITAIEDGKRTIRLPTET